MSTLEFPSAVWTPRPRERRRIDDLLKVVPGQAEREGNLFSSELRPFVRCGDEYRIPKFVFMGPPGGDSYARVGLFGGIHGDEEAGSIALAELLRRLHEEPAIALGLELIVYPVCNPTGYEDNTRWSRSGADLNREFWLGSREPEVALIEEQLEGLRFDGIISLHADDTSNGVYGYAGGDVLTRNLLEPALVAAEAHLPRNRTSPIDGWNAQEGIIEDFFDGVLSAPPGQSPRPFEIILETPQLTDIRAQVDAHLAALLAIFRASRTLRAHGANI